MRGFQKGCPVIEDLVADSKPDIFLLQEHWLTPANMVNFDTRFTDHFSFGSSAMSRHVESGMLRGRPFGGVMTMIRNELRAVTETVLCDERSVIIRVANCLIVNVYMSCVGTVNRQMIYDDILSTITDYCGRHSDCVPIIAGDFNVNLGTADAVSK